MNIEAVRERIGRACAKVGRKQEEIQIVAVTKNVPVERIELAIQSGLDQIGESRIQESQGKFEALRPKFPAVVWHLIGHLQGNKISSALGMFDLIQSVDSLDLLKKISVRARNLGKVQDCLVEVKVSEEAAKTGLLPAEMERFLEEAGSLENVRLKGVLCMAPYFEDAERARPYFAKGREILEKYRDVWQVGEKCPVLSMGMSHDFEAAVQEGSSMVRIGAALFGERKLII
ncbi:MAG: YggS family pyridoxal phosphate-dependent enzyme [Elusimicrobia bacterium]|nr:YggS family pyridoxal phosphate-dependent enzyme [Elusimicrobiota bacterium]